MHSFTTLDHRNAISTSLKEGVVIFERKGKGVGKCA
jgi:hypothetical protein